MDDESAERVQEFVVQLQQRLAAGEADARAAVLLHLPEDFLRAHFPVGLVVRIAEGALQVAPAQPHEHHGGSSPEPFALEAVEYFVYSVHGDSSASLRMTRRYRS